jgi:hypothetical protein
MVMQMLGSFAEFEHAWSVNGPRRPGGRSRSGARLRRPAKFALHQQQEVIKAVRDGSKQRRTLRAFSGCIAQNTTRLLGRSDLTDQKI